LNTRKWETKSFEHGPPERSSHSATIKDGLMYVFGGKDTENEKLGDFWVYDISNQSWSEIEIPSGEGPISRSGHSTGVFKNYIIIYAGIHELTQELSDMYLYSTKNNTWATLFEEEYSPVHHRSHHSSFSSGKINITIFLANRKDSPKHSDDNQSAYKTGSPDKVIILESFLVWILY